VPSPSLAGEVAIADTFNVNDGLELAQGTGAIAPPSPDDVSGFRFMCKPGQVSRDDPVVYPGQPGASHLHQFWGNTGTNANSTYQSLRTTGQSTCDNRGSNIALNRSAYWMPAMLDGAGNVVEPDMINTYYKQLPHSSPNCSSPPNGMLSVGTCVDIPNGLRFVFGYNMATGKGGPTDPTSLEYYNMWFECWSDLIGTPSPVASAQGRFHSIADLVAAGVLGRQEPRYGRPPIPPFGLLAGHEQRNPLPGRPSLRPTEPADAGGVHDRRQFRRGQMASVER
jgi:hypothetical protein